MEHILSLLVFFPAMAGLLGFLVTKESIRAYGISVTAIEFFLSIVLWIGYDSNNAGYQFVEYYPFIPSYGMSYYLGVDGISLFLVILSTFITMISFIALSIKNEIKNAKKFHLPFKFILEAFSSLFVELENLNFFLMLCSTKRIENTKISKTIAILIAPLKSP